MCTYLQGEVVGIAVVDALLYGLDTDDRQNRAERLLPCNSHVRSDVVDEEGRDQVPVSLPLLQNAEHSSN